MENKMTEESFLLVSLKEDDAKQLAQVLSNDTSRKILDYLSKKDNATESELAEGLNMPISTVHYNLGHLVTSKLINDDHFTYSKKGKEMVHYSLSNKYVIIAPRSTEGLKEKLRGILPLFTAVLAVSAGIRFIPSLFAGSVNSLPKQELLAATDMAESAGVMAMRSIPETGVKAMDFVLPYSQIALWFFIGGVFTILALLVSLIIIQKKK
ncbi:helix-turn-helix domain-containing protein [Candidatus Woesearchaeota archaeon]|nr:helix-turn-helix domain-containing protein [Candidatus Woesearchaeota archaeon]